MKELDGSKYLAPCSSHELIMEALTKYKEVSMKRDRYCESDEFQLAMNNEAEDMMDEFMKVACHATALYEEHEITNSRSAMKIAIE